MSFYVERKLATGMFRFIASRRRELGSIDDDAAMSTGATGEFVRHRPEIFYSADHRPIRNPELPKPRSISTTPFWASLVDGTPRGWTFVGMMAFGALLILLGFAVLADKGKQGWVEVIFGLALVAVPIAMTARKRTSIHAQEEKRRVERAERDARDRELLAAYAATLDQLRDQPGDASLAAVRLEREKLDLPYSIWSDAACATVLQVGFNALARLGHGGSAEIAKLMDRASEAAGLVAEDALGVKHALYATVLWHYLADDRLGTAQTAVVESVKKGLAIANDDVPVETSSREQFERLRGIDHRNVPRAECTLALAPREYCIYATAVKNGETRSGVQLTNKRLVFEGPKPHEVVVTQIDDINVNADEGTVTLRVAGAKAPLVMLVDEPVYFASMISLATTLDDRPRSFM